MEKIIAEEKNLIRMEDDYQEIDIQNEMTEVTTETEEMTEEEDLILDLVTMIVKLDPILHAILFQKRKKK